MVKARTYSIGEPAAKFGAAHTLRFYAQPGLLNPQRMGQRRAYRQSEERQFERCLEILEEKRQLPLYQHQDVENALTELEKSKRLCRSRPKRFTKGEHSAGSAPHTNMDHAVVLQTRG